MKEPKRPKRFVVIPVADRKVLQRQEMSQFGFLGPKPRGEAAAGVIAWTNGSRMFQVVARRFPNPAPLVDRGLRLCQPSLTVAGAS